MELRERYRSWGILICSFLLYASLVFFLMPARLIARSDDFGYIQSLARTIHAGRPIAGEWNGPWNYILPLLGSLIFKASGSFYLGSIGLLSMCTLANFFLIFALLKQRLNFNSSLILTFLICLSPVYLNKSLDYTGVVPTITIFLAAILVYGRSKAAFYLLVLVGTLSRQNTIALLALPGYDWCITLMEKRRVSWPPVFSVIALATACLLLRQTMNVTYGQQYMNFVSSPRDKMLTLFISIISCFALLGILTAILTKTDHAFALLKTNLKAYAKPLVLTLIFCLSCVMAKYIISFESPTLKARWAYVLLYLGYLISFWFIDFKALRVSRFGVVLALYAALLAFRGMIWDYYLFEIFFLLLLYIFECTPPKRELGLNPMLVGIALAACLAHAYLLKMLLDRTEIATVVAESLLRVKKIKVQQLSEAPFGLRGWKTLDYFIAHDGAGGANLAIGSFGYFNSGDLKMEFRPSFFGPFPDQTTATPPLFSGKGRVGLLPTEFRFVQMAPQEWKEAPFKLNERDYKEEIFPLNDAEWRTYLSAL